MGGSSSILGEDVLSLYEELTFLSRAEILYLLKKFSEIFKNPNAPVLEIRIPFEHIMEKFPQLKYNPFRDRICAVFSSQYDGKFSFEDILDLYSVMSEDCPVSVKATWAFRIFDFDDDNEIGGSDILTMIDRLTSGYENEYQNDIGHQDKIDIMERILEEIDIENSGTIGQMAFEHGLAKIPEFSSCLTFKI